MVINSEEYCLEGIEPGAKKCAQIQIIATLNKKPVKFMCIKYQQAMRLYAGHSFIQRPEGCSKYHDE